MKMIKIFIFFFILFELLPYNVIPCNCAPPFPIKVKKDDPLYNIKSRFYDCDIIVLAKILEQKEVKVGFGNNGYLFSEYKSQIVQGNIDPKYTTFQNYLNANKNRGYSVEYKALVYKSLKNNVLCKDTIYFLSTLGMCGAWFQTDSIYEIGAHKLINIPGYNWCYEDSIGTKISELHNCIFTTGSCFIKNADSLSFKLFSLKWIDN